MKSPKPKKEQPQAPSLPAKIRPERNIEKWSIWQPANARTAPKVRIIERNIPLPDGTSIVARLRIKPTVDDGNLTTADQRVYYALVKLWEEKGRCDPFTSFSLRRLLRTLKRKWNAQNKDLLIASLLRLRGTLFVWEEAFTDGASKRRLELLDTFNILSDLKIARHRSDGHVTTEVGYFRFHEAIIKNLLADHTKPVLFDVVLSFKSDISQIIYIHLDLVLSDKTSYERRTRELFEDLGLEGKAYNNLSDRRRILDRALRELQGKPLTTGTITTARLEPTKDGGDFKLVVRKGKAKVGPTLPLSNVIPLPLPSPEPPSESEELVKHFHKVFHGADKCYSTAKALDQAATLIARHGAEKARHIIEVAKREAQKTGHKIATFGGIMQYETPALADFEQKRHDRERQRAAEAKRRAEAEREAKERAEQARILAYWNALNADEQRRLEAEALEQAEATQARTYREMLARRNPLKRSVLRCIREAHIRKLLGFAPLDAPAQ